MAIYVSVKEGDSPKSRGDLLEVLAKTLLESRDFEVETEIRKTGMELDLLCQSKPNPSKKIYVECKAYEEDNKIHANIIKNLVGILHIENYQEAWLISTSEIGKDAKGLIHNIQNSSAASNFTFYTPEKLLGALQSARIVINREIAVKKSQELVGNNGKLGATHFLVSPFGNFWFTEYIKGSVLKGLLFNQAENGEIITDEDTIDNLLKLDFKFKTSDLGIVFRLLDPNDKTVSSRRLRGTSLNGNYLAKISDPGLSLSIPHKHTPSIDDIFVYPDLETIDIDQKKDTSSSMSSERIISTANNPQNWLLFGDDLSGKTTLSYVIQNRISNMGKLAVHLAPANVMSINVSTFDKIISKAFSDQYDVAGIPQKTVESYIADNKSEIVLIIDDFDKIQFKKAGDRAKLVNYLKENYFSIVVLANASKELEFTTSSQNQEFSRDFSIHRILQLGHERRDSLIEKWVNLNNEEPVGDKQLLEAKNDISKKINTAIGTNYLPTYPFYCLTILEMFESGGKAKLQGSEYAELYGYFITHALMLNGVKPKDLGFYSAYLSYLASTLHARDTTALSESDIKEIFTSHLQAIGLDRPFDAIHTKLVASKILRLDSGHYSFNLSYYRYYFFAKYLSDSIDEQETKDIIESLVDNLHQDDHANTVVFLVHHSKNTEIIDVILQKAKEQFASIELQTLSREEVVNINELINEDMQFVLKDGSVSEHRKKELKRQDDYERSQRNSSKTENILGVYDQITLAFRTIDVLGKITSNYYGELKANRKYLIIRELYELGFRSLRTFLESFESYIGTLRTHLETKIDDKNLESAVAKQTAANQIIYSFTHIITYSFIKRVSDSVASKDLSITVDDVLSGEVGPIAKLTSIAIKLNFPESLNRYKDEIARLYADLSDNSLARDLLRFMVLEHLYKFEVGYQDKQSICNQLKIDVTAVNRKKLKSNTGK